MFSSVLLRISSIELQQSIANENYAGAFDNLPDFRSKQLIIRFFFRFDNFFNFFFHKISSNTKVLMPLLRYLVTLHEISCVLREILTFKSRRSTAMQSICVKLPSTLSELIKRCLCNEVLIEKRSKHRLSPLEML